MILFAQMSCVVFLIVSRVPKLRTLLVDCVAQRFGAGNPTMIQIAQMSCVSVLLVSRVPKLRTLRVACRGGSEQGTSR